MLLEDDEETRKTSESGKSTDLKATHDKTIMHFLSAESTSNQHLSPQGIGKPPCFRLL